MSDCIQKINVSGQAFCSWCHKMIRYGPINQHFVRLFLFLFFCLCQVYLIFIWIFANFGIVNNSDPGIRRGNEDSGENENENRKSLNKIFSKGTKSASILFSQ